MKQYKGWEIAKMICEGTLKEKYTIQDDRGYTYKLDKDKLRENDFLCDNNISLNMFVDKERNYIILSQSVTFDEIVHSDKKCRVEHELIDKLMSNEENDFDFTEYMEIDEVLFELTNQCEASETRDVLLNGRWYLEE